MKFSLDQRRYRLDMSRKQIQQECDRRGRKVSYSAVCKAFTEPEELLPNTIQKIEDTITELEKERGITSTDMDF